MTESAVRKRPIRWIAFAVIFLLMIGGIAFVYWYMFSREVVSSDDARLVADMVDIAPQVSGRLDTVHAGEGDMVPGGATLFELDSALLKATLEKAVNDLNSARLSLTIAETDYRKIMNGPRPEEVMVAETAVKSAEEQLRLAKLEWNRVDALYRDKSITQSEWDSARTNADLAQNNYDSAMDKLRLLQLGNRDEDRKIAAQTVELRKAQIASYESLVNQARINLELATVKAPFDGVVVRQWRKPGAVISPGTAVFTMIDTSTFRVSANIEEKFLNRVAIGDEVDITVDAYPGLELKGHVKQILQAANSEFSLIPSEGVSGTYIKVAQRIPLKIVLDNPEQLAGLHAGPGMSVEVHIHTGAAPGGDNTQ